VRDRVSTGAPAAVPSSAMDVAGRASPAKPVALSDHYQGPRAFAVSQPRPCHPALTHYLSVTVRGLSA